jgi:hypothetical protein
VTGDLMGGKKGVPRRSPIAKSIPMQRFLQALFGDRSIAAPAAEIGRAIRAARSLRQTEGESRGGVQANPAVFAPGGPPAGLEEAVSGGGRGPTEVERPQARKTESVGETRGFWLLLLATPHRGRAIPCGSEDDSRPG